MKCLVVSLSRIEERRLLILLQEVFLKLGFNIQAWKSENTTKHPEEVRSEEISIQEQLLKK